MARLAFAPGVTFSPCATTGAVRVASSPPPLLRTRPLGPLLAVRLAAQPADDAEAPDERTPKTMTCPPPLTWRDTADLWVTNIMQTYGGAEATDGAPIAEGEVSDLTGGPFFIALKKYADQFGPIYKLAFGPKQFIVVSDPVIARHILRDNWVTYDKGILAEILEPIMGKGLIPADFDTWKKRRRAIAPGFHAKWLARMLDLFADCTEVLVDKLDKAVENGKVVEMESQFCSVSLDIIGKAVFNYDFGSVTRESPLIKAVYRTLRESEHRATFYLPYWNFEPLNWIVPRQVQFRKDMNLINETLTNLINEAVESKSETDLEDLQRRDYNNVGDVSLLRFLVDLRGEESTGVQLRDDLMTMLIAGHETTGAVLTWAAFYMAQNPQVVALAREEVDRVLGDKRPTMEDIHQLQYIRWIICESLRLFPEPPVLIRRALADDVMPKGASDVNVKIKRGTDIFISLYGIHRSEMLWENPEAFDPSRFGRPFKNPDVTDWKGYQPNPDFLYPNEFTSDYAYLPFGGGARKCVGDQFATLESTVCLAMLVRRFDFSLAGPPENVGFATGATVHTENGLNMRVARRKREQVPEDTEAAAELQETTP